MAWLSQRPPVFCGSPKRLRLHHGDGFYGCRFLTPAPTRSPNVFWVNLADMDFAEGKPTKKLTLTGSAIFACNAAAQFQPAEHLKFLPATVK
jgi:hypothetical protein